MHPLSDIKKLYFHDGSLEQIDYDRVEKQLLLKVELPEEVNDLELEFDYGDSLCGLMTFFDVPSIDCPEDYNLINHPKTGSADMLSVDVLDANTVRLNVWYQYGKIPYIVFKSSGFTWESQPC